jgi:GNAT superfamily N-acetyltransferase
MVSDHITIRTTKTEDVEGLWPLVQDFALSYRPDRSLFTPSFHGLLERSDSPVLVAVEDAGPLVGHLLDSLHGRFFANGAVAWIEELMVSESARRRGAATNLMPAAEDWTKTIHTSCVALARRRARDFYRSIGYDESATYFRKTFDDANR